MPNNSPTNLAKGGGNDKDKPSTDELLRGDAEKQELREQQMEEDVNKRPLTAEDTEPQRDAAVQGNADLALEQARGKVFGDLTSSNGDVNSRGLHGRDGGIVADGPSNPAPSDQAIAAEAEQTADDTNMAEEARENAAEEADKK